MGGGGGHRRGCACTLLDSTGLLASGRVIARGIHVIACDGAAWKLTAVAVGFVGVLIVMRPGTGAFQIESLWVLGSSSSWALASVLTRQMAGKDNAATTLLWSSAVGLIVVTLMLPFVWVVPSTRDLWLCGALGLIASSGQFLLVQAYRHAEATTLAPFSYVQLAWSVSLGYLLWGTLPDAWTWVGAAVIVASGIYTVHRERVRSRERQLAAG